LGVDAEQNNAETGNGYFTLAKHMAFFSAIVAIIDWFGTLHSQNTL
jgi:hypothetical protein